MQQQLLQRNPQQTEAALTKASAASGGFVSLDPGTKLSAVALKLPKPIPKLCSTDILCGLESSVLLFLSTFLEACLNIIKIVANHNA